MYRDKKNNCAELCACELIYRISNNLNIKSTTMIKLFGENKLIIHKCLLKVDLRKYILPYVCVQVFIYNSKRVNEQNEQCDYRLYF